ncbi:folate family ECF transporter S component [Proteinivorax hydrogeniformans]|uniref:Folate family ECF transporter S component n=1 Tax=Proteinivorax hydrogeniformans TaxID=1826727 RepID=A0AAU8HUT7_9FIRM
MNVFNFFANFLVNFHELGFNLQILCFGLLLLPLFLASMAVKTNLSTQTKAFWICSFLIGTFSLIMTTDAFIQHQGNFFRSEPIWFFLTLIFNVILPIVYIMTIGVNNDKKIPTQHLVYGAILMATSIALTRLVSIQLPTTRIGFGPIPIITASILLGPATGALVGAGSDIIGIIIAPQGAPIFWIFMAQTLYGVIPFFVLKLFKEKTPLAFAAATVVTQFVCGSLTTYGLAITFEWPLIETFVTRMPGQLINMGVYSFVVYLLNGKVFSKIATSPLTEIK